MPEIAWSGSSSSHPSDVAERPMDLSTQSAANSKTPLNITAGQLSQSDYDIAADAVNARSASCFSPVSNCMPRESLTLPTVCCSGHIFSANSFPYNSTCNMFTIASGGVNRSTITADVLANLSTAVKSTASSHAADSSIEKTPDDGCVSESDRTVNYPKTKKQKAVDGKMSSLTSSLSAPALDGSVLEYEALTFGEIQERLITRVVESGSLSDVLRDERQHMNKHPMSGISTGKLPTGQISHCEARQIRPCLPVEVIVSEQCNVQKAGSASVTSAASFPTKQLSVASTTRGLWMVILM